MDLRFLQFSSFCVTLVLLSFDHGTQAERAFTSLRSNKRHGKQCNIFQGHWVHDSTYKPYDPAKCPFTRKEFACNKYGRKDDHYLKYRWQPKNCNIARFDAKDFLKRFRGKKIMFVGDSLSRNAWVSLSCLLHAAMPKSNFTAKATKAMTKITFREYGLSVIHFHSLYLVEVGKSRQGRVMKIDSIKNGNIWRTMDVLIFNTYHWWERRGARQSWDYIKDGSKTYRDMNRMAAFRKGLMTWARWVNSDIDSNKTTVFFQGVSPSHYKGKAWNRPRERNCAKQTHPLKGSTYKGGVHPATKIVKQVLGTIKKPVHLLDVTTLSQLRPDAHPGSHSGMKGWGMDCTHWCVPGLPDTWNQLLYSLLISPK